MDKDLLSFEWEEDNDIFFDVKPEGQPEPRTPKVEEEEEEEVEKPKKGRPAKTVEEVEDTFFDEKPKAKTKDIESEEEEEEEPGSTDKGIYHDYFQDLKETGILKHVELEEGEEITPERLLELQEEDNEIEINERIKAWATDLDEDAQEFIKFKRAGGTTQEFFQAYSQATSIPTGDIDDEDYQDKLIKYKLTQEGWDSDEIEDRINYLTENNKKDKIAKKYHETVKAEEQETKEELFKQAEGQKQKALKQETEFKTSIQSFLESNNEVEGIKITPKEKISIFNFLTKKEHKVSDTKSVTGFQKKLAEVFQSTDKMVLLAKLVESDFDMSSFEKKVITKKTRDIKTNLEQRKGLRTANSGSSSAGQTLSDLFN